MAWQHHQEFVIRGLDWDWLYGWQQKQIREAHSNLSETELASGCWVDVDNCMVCGSLRGLSPSPCKALEHEHVVECLGSRERALHDAAMFLRKVDAPADVVEAVKIGKLQLDPIEYRPDELLLN